MLKVSISFNINLSKEHLKTNCSGALGVVFVRKPWWQFGWSSSALPMSLAGLCFSINFLFSSSFLFYSRFLLYNKILIHALNWLIFAFQWNSYLYSLSLSLLAGFCFSITFCLWQLSGPVILTAYIFPKSSEASATCDSNTTHLLSSSLHHSGVFSHWEL